jgi:transporter family protein
VRQREALIGALLALGAATAYGINAILVKEGIQRFGVALPGLTVSVAVGLLGMALVSLRTPPAKRPPARSIGFMLLAGLCAACGVGSYFLALSLLPVSVVVPISSAYPLVTLALARLFLNQSEHLTWRTALGAACVVAGVIIVALARTP